MAYTCNQLQHSGSWGWGIMGSRSIWERLSRKNNRWKEKKIIISWVEKGKTLAEHILLPDPLSVLFLCLHLITTGAYSFALMLLVTGQEADPQRNWVTCSSSATLSGRAGTRRILLDISDSSILGSPPGCLIGSWVSLWLNDFAFSISGCFNHSSICMDLFLAFLFQIRLRNEFKKKKP